MKKLFKTYLPFTKGVIQSFAAYQINFYVYVLGDMLQTSVLLYIWFAIFNSSPNTTIQGFTFDNMIAYVVISTLTGILISNDVHWEIGQDVRTGNIAMNLIKPVSYQLRQYFASIGYLIVNFLFVCLPLWLIYVAYRFVTSSQLPAIGQLLSYGASVFLSALILFFINYLFGLAAFFVEYIFGFIFAKEALLRLFSGQLIPLAFFPASVLAVFNYLPFAGLVYTPTMIYLGKYSGQTLLFHMTIQLVWVVLLFALTQLVWRLAIKRITILGG